MYVKGQDDPVDTITLEGHDTTIKGVLCIEIGGLNSTEPMIVAAELGLPVVDMDFMGRAFPELQVCKYYSFMLFRDTHTRYYFRVVLLLWFHNAMLPRATYCGYDFRGKTFLMQKMVYVSHESVLWIWKSRGLLHWVRFDPANERRSYFVTTSLIAWAQAQNHPCNCVAQCWSWSISSTPSF